MAEETRPVEQYILTGLQRRIKEVFGLKPDYKLTTDPLLQSDGSRLESYPYPYLRLNSISHRNEETNAARGLEKTWSYGGSTKDNNGVRAYRFLNVIFHMDFNVLTNDYEDIQRMMNAWLFAYRFNSLNFGLVYDNLGLDIKVILGDTVQVPWQSEGLDEKIQFEFTGEVQVWGYVSQMVEYTGDVVKEVDINFTFDQAEKPEYTAKILWEDPLDATDSGFAPDPGSLNNGP